ncbi:MAG TPA: LEPR-XLL domain-containing protein, partial [Xanthobacteraceae bacterium]|nr:LEPR-XLL domain-containing protein [Xanthobacteraceae bacterium]
MISGSHQTGLWSRLRAVLRMPSGRNRAGDADEGQRQSRFQVEPLEPRILLSGDPVASELARLVDDATHAMFLDDHAAVVEQLTTDVVADAGHADHDSGASAVSSSHAGDERGVDWPSEWTRTDADPESVAGTANSPAHADRVDLRIALADLVAAFATEIQTSLAGQTDFTAVVGTAGPPTATGPPGAIDSGTNSFDELTIGDASVVAPGVLSLGAVETTSTSLAADIMTTTEADSVMLAPLPSDQVGSIPVSEADMARAPPVEAVSARGPPSGDYLLADASSPFTSTPAVLSATDLQSLADVALAIWSDALAANGLTLPANTPTFRVSDLADGILGWADGSVISIDADAAGHGWFVDHTPGDSSEFAVTLPNSRSAASADSDAFGRMDLLTVLIHEIGHVLGYGHDSGLAVMAESLGTGQRVQLEGVSAKAASDLPVSGALFDDGTINLAGATAANPTDGITITIEADGKATVSGASNPALNGTSTVPVTSITGNVLNRFTLIAPDVENTWHLTGLNAGDLTPDGLGSIHFTSVDYLNGGSEKDTFVIDQLGAVTGGIDDGAGPLGLQLFDFFYVSGDFDFTTATGDLVLNDGHIYNDVDYLVLSGAGVDAFVGNGPPADPTAVGLSLTALDFTFVQFVDESNVTYTALKSSGGTASLVGLKDVVLDAWDIGVQLNQASAGSAVLDFNAGGSNSGIAVTPSVGPAIDFEGEDGSLLNVVGNAAIDLAGNVAAKGGFELSVGTVKSADLPSGDTQDADAITLAFTNVDLFVGVGGGFSDPSNTPGDHRDDQVANGPLGFRATVAALTVVSIRDRGADETVTTDDRTYLGVAVDDFNASLIGVVDVLTFNAWNVDAALNKATAADGTAVTPKLDWSTFESSGLDISAAQAALNATSLGALNADVDVSVSGAATLNVLDGLVVLKVAGFEMQLGQVSGTDGVTTLTDAQALAVTLSDVTLWVGPGGSLDDGGTTLNVTDASTFSDDEVAPGDLGFSGHVGSLKLASLKDLGALATDPADDVSYLALDLSGLNASLVGLQDVLAFNAWDVGVLLNKLSAGTTAAASNPKKLDWSAFTVDAGIVLPDFNDALNAGVDLTVSGAATLNVLDGLVVLKVAGFEMQLGQVSGTDGVTTLTDAQALAVTLSDVTLWVGPGGSLDDGGTALDVTDATTFSDDEVAPGDLGFSGHVGSLKLASLKDLGALATDPADDVSYLALDLSGLNASLVGLQDVLAFNAWDVG